MDAEEPLILNLAGAILDGEAVDWRSLESTASDSQRSALAELQAIAAIGSLRRRPLTLPLSTPEPFATGTATWGKLTIREAIGRGGFGTVYRAWDSQLDREVALKLLPADEDGVNALEEGRLLAKVHHPNVVTIFGADRIGAHVGLWMEFVRGDTLEQVLANEGALAPARVAAFGRQLCEALTAVHRAGLVHRDVKAHNVMLEPSGRIVLMDFGAGRFLSGHPHDIAGTPLYLAPEIFAGEKATEQSDLYSVGVLLYHLLTARYPIEGRTVQEVRHAHQRSTTVPDIRSARPDVPRHLAVAIERALAARPADRFVSAGQMATALGRVGQPVRPALLAVAATAAVAVVVAGGGLKMASSRGGNRPSASAAAAIGSEQPRASRLSLPGAELAGSGLSDDGRYFSYLDGDGNLTVFNMSSGQTETLVDADGDQFAEFSIMSPDGGQLAYEWWTDRRSYEIRLVDRATKSVRVLLRDDSLDDPMPIAWAKDGSQILVWLKSLDGVSRIALLNVSSGDVQTVREISGGTPLGLSLSPDGRYVAYDLPISSTNPARALHVVDRSGGSDRTLPAEPTANDRFPLWTPGGQSLFFISDRSGASDGWVLPIHDGTPIGEPTLVVRNLGRVSSLGLTQAGAFYYRLQTGAFDVNEISLDPQSLAFLTAPKRVATRFTASNIAPSYSADGRQLAYVSVRDGLGGKATRAIVIKDLLTGVERELTIPVGNSPARWSPDGRRLLIGSRVVDAMTGATVHEFNVHPDKDQSSYGPTRWLPDGKDVVYEHEDKGLVRHPLAGGPEQSVYAYSPEDPVERIHRFEISPDGSRLAFSANLRDQGGTVLQVVTTGGQIELARRKFPEHLVVQGWSPDSLDVLFTTFRMDATAPHELWRIPATGGSPQRLGAIDSATQINPIAFNPTRSTLAYTTGTPMNELWMMENFLPR